MYCPSQRDYSPCICSANSWIKCEKINLEEIRQTFEENGAGRNQAFVKIDDVKLTMPPTNIAIPANLLANHYVKYNIELKCLEGRDQRIAIDLDAFSASRNFTQILAIIYCDFLEFNFLFLSGFNRLQRLSFVSITNLNLALWKTLPLLPRLNNLELIESQGLAQLTDFPNINNGLKYLDLMGNEMGDVAIDRILDCILHSSADTLVSLNLERNALTQIPRQLSNFKMLRRINLSRNQLNTIVLFGSLSFSNETGDLFQEKELDLASCGITAIESNAFQGL